MTFDDILEQVLALLKRQGRVSYSALRRRFEIDDAYLNDLKDELFFAYPVTDENDSGLVWNGETETRSEPTSQPDQISQSQLVVEQTEPTPVEPIPDEPHTPDSAERRQLTILFTDLVGSTKLSGQLDAEEYRDVVRAYQSTCSKVIAQFGCFIAQTLGDGLLVYSGYPVASERDAENAVRTGLGIVEAMTTLNERLEREKGIRLAVRTGIHTGQCVIGEIRAGERQEQLALGEVPNIAARIQGLAEPDTVVISSDTYRLIRGYVDCESLGEHELKGVSEPMSVYRVLQASGAQTRLDVVSPRGLTPFIGRAFESTLLFERWEQVKDGHGQVILLSGEAGIGKSRLVQVLKDHVANEQHTSLARLECRSSPYFTDSALYPIIDMVQRTLRFQADDTSETKLEKLEEQLRQYRLPLAEMVPLFGALLSLPVPEDHYPPLNWTPQRQRQKTLEVITSLILEIAQQHPVLFIFEDVHWLDASTNEFLDLLIDQTPTTQLLVLITYRPEFQPTWGNRSYLTQVTLNRLSRDEVERIAMQVVGGKTLPSEVIEQLVERTDGVPLYAEEMTKAVLESGVLKETDGQYELSSSISTLSIPATLQDSLMARLDRLVTAKAVAQLGAVVGRQFSYELLQAVSQLDETVLRHELGRLVEAELVYQRGLPPQATYTFKHALVQDTAYESLLRSTRQGYHRRIAETLEQQFPETTEQPELLAHHYTEAGLNEPAVAYWHQAGERASESSAIVEAVSHFEKGLGVLQMLPDTSERAQQELALQVALCPALIVLKGNAGLDVERTCARALQLCQQLQDRSQHFAVLQSFIVHYNVRPDYHKAYDLGQQLLALAGAQQDADRLLEAHRALGATLLYSGDVGEARDHFEQAIAFYDPQQSHSLAVRAGVDPGVGCYIYNALALWWLGYPDQGEELVCQGIRLAQDSSHLFTKGWAFLWAAHFHQCRRDIQAVQELIEQSLSICTDLGAELFIAEGYIFQGWGFAMRGRSAEGIGQLQRGLESWRATQAHAWVPYHLSMLAEAYCQNGQIEEACVVLAEALDLVDQHKERFYESELHRLKGTLLLFQSSDNQTEAETCFHQAIAIAQNQAAKSWELRATTSLARLWQSQDKHQAAYDLLAPIYGWFTEGFDTADLIAAKILLDQLTEGAA